jgi:hypothetical protein
MADAQAPEPEGKKAQPKAAEAAPAFARGYPDDPELRALVAAFERGANHVVREQAEKLAQSTSNPEVAKAARDLRSRIEPDPLAVKLLLAAVALLIFLSAWAYHTAH